MERRSAQRYIRKLLMWTVNSLKKTIELFSISEKKSNEIKQNSPFSWEITLQSVLGNIITS